MQAPDQQTLPKSTRAADFKYYPAESFNLAFSDNGAKLVVGVTELDGSIMELAGFHMSHQTAVQLRDILNQAFEHFEKATGRPLSK